MKEAPSLRASLLRELPRHRLHFRICMRKTDGYRACAGKAPFGGGKNRKTKNRTCAKISGPVFCLDNGAAPVCLRRRMFAKRHLFSVRRLSLFGMSDVFRRHGGLPVSLRNPRSCHFSSVLPRFRPRDGNGTFPAAALRPAQEYGSFAVRSAAAGKVHGGERLGERGRLSRGSLSPRSFPFPKHTCAINVSFA